MKTIFSFFMAAAFLWSCSNEENKKTIAGVRDSTAKQAPPGNEGTAEPVTDTNTIPPPPDTSDRPKENERQDMLEGRHNLTLQWIGWNVPGLAVIKKDKEDWYSIKGRQESKTGYLIIDGKIRPTGKDLRELEFEGLVEYKEATINNNQPCAKNGKQKFLSTQGRKYWRLQNMINCDGITTDYVDIYF